MTAAKYLLMKEQKYNFRWILIFFWILVDILEIDINQLIGGVGNLAMKYVVTFWYLYPVLLILLIVQFTQFHLHVHLHWHFTYTYTYTYTYSHFT